MDQRGVYNEFNGQMGSNKGHIPNTEESRKVWSGIWNVKKEHNKKADWLSDLKKEMVNLEQQNVVVQFRTRSGRSIRAPRTYQA